MKKQSKKKQSNLPAKFSAGYMDLLDGRTSLKKRLSATFDGLAGDIGGVDSLPHAKLIMIERATFLEEVLRQVEVKLVDDPTGNQELLGRWAQSCNALNGLLKSIGMPRSRAGGPQDWIDNLYTDDEEPENTAENARERPAKGVKLKGR